MTIEEEAGHLFAFLSHPAGFDVNMGGVLCIRPISEDSPPTFWEVDWEDIKDGVVFSFAKEFASLAEAVNFFVEKRRYLCEGLDFQIIRMKDVGLIE